MTQGLGILDGILNEIAPSALLPRNDAGNSRIFVIASEAKQSLGILDLSLGILDFCSL